MTKNETAQILAVLKVAYPNFYKNSSNTDIENAINLWQNMFADESYELVQLAIKMFISSDVKGFPPSIGLIKERIIEITSPKELTEQEAWEMVRLALSNSIYNYKAEWNKLPEIIKSMTSPGQLREWAVVDTETVNSVIASNFMRSYRARSKNHKEYAALSSDIKKTLSAISNKIALKTIEEKNHEQI